MIGTQNNSAIDSPPHVASSQGRLLHFLRRCLFNIFLVAVFAVTIGAACWLALNRHYQLLFISILSALMTGALFVGETWRERIGLGLCVPFLGIGGYVGFQIYFAMFHFSWFESVFNDKAGGPLGLIVFVFGFAIAAAFGAAWCIDRLLGAGKKASGAVDQQKPYRDR